MTDDAVLDHAARRELRAMVGDEELAALTERLILQGDAAIAAIGAAIDAGDADTAAKQAHRMAGGAATLGCATLAHALSDLDRRLRTGAVPDAAERTRLSALWQATRAALAKA